MDKNAIKKFAVWARRELIDRVSQKAEQYGITEKDHGDIRADHVNGRLLSRTEQAQRQSLITRIDRAGKDGYREVMEEVAYTWFNRFIALRFMEVNGYLPSRVRVFTDEQNAFKPQILTEAIHLELDGLDTLELPDLSTQEKYVAIYKAMQANQQSYERGLEDLKLVCEGYIKELRHTAPVMPIRDYLVEMNERNDAGLSLEAVRGLATSKEMIPTKADMHGVSLKNYKVVKPRQIAYVPDTSRRGDKVSLGFNDSDEDVLVSSISVVFGTDHDYLLPEYLMLFLTRSEFDRYARYNSWGSARETFTFDDLGEMKIPIPSIGIQQSISQIFATYKMRNSICERLKSQLSAICPILIRGSLSDGG